MNTIDIFILHTLLCGIGGLTFLSQAYLIDQKEISIVLAAVWFYATYKCYKNFKSILKPVKKAKKPKTKKKDKKTKKPEKKFWN